MQLNDFLKSNNISSSEWENSQCDWAVLQEIAADYRRYKDDLAASAELYAKVIQKIPQVHSVRWRVKEESHLLEKIVRKSLEKREKYLSINKDNYFEVVTDLVGLRALHLFKDECIEIHDAVTEKWSPAEDPIAYIRDGDGSSDSLRQLGLLVKVHPAGYRSLHYVFSFTPLQRVVHIELQVRTIFEEGWSEIDHRIRYPKFSNNPFVSYFLTIFNRLAGSADEMGSFVKILAWQLDGMEQQLESAALEKEQILAQMTETVAKLESEKSQGEASKAMVIKLKKELQSLRANANDKLFTNLVQAIVMAAEKFSEPKPINTIPFPESAGAASNKNFSDISKNAQFVDYFAPDNGEKKD